MHPNDVKFNINEGEQSDAELVENCKFELPHQARSFRQLMKRYHNKVLSKAESMLGSLDDAKDATQEIFLKVYANLPKFELRSSFSTWLYIVTVNTCLNIIDKRKRSPHWWMTEDIENVYVEQEESEIFLIMGKGVEKKDVAECIERTLNDVGKEDRHILELRFLDELDYDSIATKLSIGLSAMKMRLKRARESFRKLFERQCLG